MKNFKIKFPFFTVTFICFLSILIITPFFLLKNQYVFIKRENNKKSLIDKIVDKKWRVLHVDLENNFNQKKDRIFVDYCNKFGFEYLYFSSKNNTYTTDLTRCIDKIHKTYTGNWSQLNDSTIVLQLHENKYTTIVKNISDSNVTIKIFNRNNYNMKLELVTIKLN